MSSQGGLLSVHSKTFVKFCVVLSNNYVWAWFYISLGSLQRWCSYVCFVCLCWTYGGFLSKKKPQKQVE